MIRYTIQMPVGSVTGLAKRVVLVSVNAAEPPVPHEFAAEPKVAQLRLDFQEGDSVSMVIKDVDTRGVAVDFSDPLTFTAIIPDAPPPPPKPGTFGVLSIEKAPV